MQCRAFTVLDKLGYGCLVFGLGQFLILTKMPQNRTLASKVVKSDLKVIMIFSLSKALVELRGLEAMSLRKLSLWDLFVCLFAAQFRNWVY
jgi:hypothetical protein